MGSSPIDFRGGGKIDTSQNQETLIHPSTLCQLALVGVIGVVNASGCFIDRVSGEAEAATPASLFLSDMTRHFPSGLRHPPNVFICLNTA